MPIWGTVVVRPFLMGRYEKGCDEMSEKRAMVECRFKDKVFKIDPETFSRILFEVNIGDKDFVRFKTGAERIDCSERQYRDIAADADAIYGIGKMRFVDPKQVKAFILSSKVPARYL